MNGLLKPTKVHNRLDNCLQVISAVILLIDINVHPTPEVEMWINILEVVTWINKLE